MVCILYAISIYTLCYSIKWTICLADQWQSLGNQFEIIIIFYNSGHSWGTEMRYLTFPVIISSEFRGNWDYSLEYCTSLSVSSPDFRVVLLFVVDCWLNSVVLLCFACGPTANIMSSCCLLLNFIGAIFRHVCHWVSVSVSVSPLSIYSSLVSNAFELFCKCWFTVQFWHRCTRM